MKRKGPRNATKKAQRRRTKLIERLKRRGALLTDILTALLGATVAAIVALLGLWVIEWAAKRLGMHEGTGARILEELKTAGAWLTFVVYSLIELRDIIKGNSDED